MMTMFSNKDIHHLFSNKKGGELQWKNFTLKEKKKWFV